MLSDVIFSLDRVTPYFLLIALGVFLRGCGLVSRGFFRGANRFTVRVALPVHIFYSITAIERTARSAVGFLFYVFAVTLVSFAVIWILTELAFRNDRAIIGTLVQGAFRGNFVILGIPMAAAAMGPSAAQAAALSSIILVPAYNVLSVVVLRARGKDSKNQSLSGILRGIATNPLIITISCAIPFWLLGIRLPQMLQTTCSYIGGTATPLGLLCIGGLLKFSDVTARLRPALYSVAIKNVILPIAVMFISYYLGFRGEELLVLLVASAAPVAISSYAMANELGGDGSLASNILIISTFLSSFTLAVGFYLLKSLSLI